MAAAIVFFYIISQNFSVKSQYFLLKPIYFTLVNFYDKMDMDE